MGARRESDSNARWWVSTAAAALVHSMVLLAPPDTSVKTEAAPVWMSAQVVDAALQIDVSTPGSKLALRSQAPGVEIDAAPDDGHCSGPCEPPPPRSVTTQPARARAIGLARSAQKQAPAAAEQRHATTATGSERQHAEQTEFHPLAASTSPLAPAPAGLVHAPDEPHPLAAPASPLGGALSKRDGTGRAPSDHVTGAATPARSGEDGTSRSHAAGSARARGPGLLARGDICSRYFPSHAHANLGRVQISVQVDAAGHARASRVLLESPLGNEFGSAARACAAALRFVPAIDRRGAPVAGEAKLELRFRRS
jgi:hypothetical protein